MRPYFKKNSELLEGKKLWFSENTEPRLYLEVKKLHPDGKAPLARYGHTTEFMNPYLYVFGGRNDSVYKEIKNSALNDLHMFDVEN